MFTTLVKTKHSHSNLSCINFSFLYKTNGFSNKFFNILPLENIRKDNVSKMNKFNLSKLFKLFLFCLKNSEKMKFLIVVFAILACVAAKTKKSTPEEWKAYTDFKVHI